MQSKKICYPTILKALLNDVVDCWELLSDEPFEDGVYFLRSGCKIRIQNIREIVGRSEEQIAQDLDYSLSIVLSQSIQKGE